MLWFKSSLIKIHISSIFFKKTHRPSTHFLELPIELCLYIAEFIPKDDMRKLAGVNRAFYELVMDDLYHQLTFVYSNSWLFIFLLESLKNPTLAKRVHTLHTLKIWPGAVDDALNSPNIYILVNQLSSYPVITPVFWARILSLHGARADVSQISIYHHFLLLKSAACSSWMYLKGYHL
ncbi:hypothetical protein BDQ12DRAFT_264165 [Crucibulum laeve]|uniref:F-box domain-containing protein n=1 Tax=Crucibulum laeve TaxID=68775 RepID=A0A5C3LUM6_9AGAR|nr:hypothetical protein BDQ12DRAFT_264165 [Crucibulum laeve]